MKLSPELTGAVELRADAFLPPTADPITYPGVRPPFSFVTIPQELDSQNAERTVVVMPIKAQDGAGTAEFILETPDGDAPLNEVLNAYGVARMEERLPVIGFGSNASPGQLISKFNTRFADLIPNQNDQLIVPTLFGTVEDLAAVYSSKFGIHSYVFAELTRRAGVETRVAVNFLTPEQLTAMNKSEGAYHLCRLGCVAIDGLERPIDAFGYAGKNNVLLHSKDDQPKTPILLDAVTREADSEDWPVMSEAQVLAYLTDTLGYRFASLYPRMPQDFQQGMLRSEEVQQRAEALVLTGQRRTDYVRRNPTKKAAYKHLPPPGEDPDRLIGDAIQQVLATDRLVGESNLLSTIPEADRDVTPPPFLELYSQ